MDRSDTVAVGRRAESAAADHLRRLGYAIVDCNWRRRECEIDLVARRAGTVYFVEVKYRSSNVAGSGIEYIGYRKLRRMAYAARRWVAESRWAGSYALSAVEVSGPGYEVTAFVESIDY